MIETARQAQVRIEQVVRRVGRLILRVVVGSLIHQPPALMTPGKNILEKAQAVIPVVEQKFQKETQNYSQTM